MYHEDVFGRGWVLSGCIACMLRACSSAGDAIALACCYHGLQSVSWIPHASISPLMASCSSDLSPDALVLIPACALVSDGNCKRGVAGFASPISPAPETPPL